jgi:hypothetical protein
LSSRLRREAFARLEPYTTATPSTTAIAPTVLQKDTYPRIAESDTFSGDRKKFKAYET